MSNLVTIEGKTRTEKGKGFCRKLRKSGMIPANIIEKGKATMIELNPKFLSVAWQADRTFILDLNGEQKKVTIKELQLHKLKRTPLHVDLMYA